MTEKAQLAALADAIKAYGDRMALLLGLLRSP